MIYKWTAAAVQYLTHEQWLLVADVFGKTTHVQSSVDWSVVRLIDSHYIYFYFYIFSYILSFFILFPRYNNLLKMNDMVDTFAEKFPYSMGRYTCWEQYTNRRLVSRLVVNIKILYMTLLMFVCLFC